MYSMSLYPTITKPSRITSHSPTIIDNIYTNIMGSLTTSGLFICDITDHLPVFTLVDCDVKKTRSTRSTVYRESDVDSAYGHFLDIFISLYNTHCPAEERCIKTNKTKSPWLTKGILNACKKKSNLYKVFIKLKTKEAEQRYKIYRNNLTDIIRTSKKLYYRKIYENINNTKVTWDILNNLIKQGSAKVTYPDYFSDKNGVNHDMDNIVNSFNSFFCKCWPRVGW